MSRAVGAAHVDDDALNRLSVRRKHSNNPAQQHVVAGSWNLFWNNTQVEGYLKVKTAKVGSPFLFQGLKEKRSPPLRGETSARLMRRTAVRQSSSTLRLWCLSMIHSMIQNILKYRTVIIGLQNTHPHVLGIYILNFFRGRGSGLPRRQNCLKASCLCLYILTQEVCWACWVVVFFTLSNDDRWRKKKNHIDSALLSQAETCNVLFTYVNTSTRSLQRDTNKLKCRFFEPGPDAINGVLRYKVFHLQNLGRQ